MRDYASTLRSTYSSSLFSNSNNGLGNRSHVRLSNDVRRLTVAHIYSGNFYSKSIVNICIISCGNNAPNALGPDNGHYSGIHRAFSRTGGR